jgi:8-oxo-dGTP pyrophosphatase MutT (NUDIX family)
MDRMAFQVTIKGLSFDDEGRLLLVKQKDGIWDLPGGRLEHGEDLVSALRRECLEEMGIACDVRDRAPRVAWSARDGDGTWKVVLCFRITLPHLNIEASDECVEIGFFDHASILRIGLAEQTRPIVDHWNDVY